MSKYIQMQTSDGSVQLPAIIDSGYLIKEAYSEGSVNSTYLKFSNGYMLVYGHLYGILTGTEIKFPVPFIDNEYEIVMTQSYGASPNIRSIAAWWLATKTCPIGHGFSIYNTTYGGSTSEKIYAGFIAIGRWK